MDLYLEYDFYLGKRHHSHTHTHFFSVSLVIFFSLVDILNFGRFSFSGVMMGK
jgi:hypothetical protein